MEMNGGGEWTLVTEAIQISASTAIPAVTEALAVKKRWREKMPGILGKWWYYFRVANIKAFIAQHFGKAKTFTKEEFKKNCKKGIVILNVPWQDATGHADL